MTDAASGISITRTFAAPRERVYDAWLTPEHFATWFGGSEGLIAPESVDMDAVAGGRWSATMHFGPDRFEISWSGNYVQLDRANTIVMTMTDQAGAVETDPSEYITVGFTDVDGGTRMVFHQGGDNLPAEQIEQTRAGWKLFFDELATIVER